MRRSQRGAALVYGLFTLMGSAAALFFLFNTGQLVREKNQLVNTADAVAYSAGVLQAKSLNYLAYTNRSFIANEVLVAQAVSLKSWAGYLGSWQGNLMGAHPECFARDPWSMVVGGASASFKFDLKYALPCWLLAQDQVQGTGVVSTLATAVDQVGEVSLGLVYASQKALSLSQSMLMSRMAAGADRQRVLRTIAQQNFPESPDGTRLVVGVEAGLPDDWLTFTQMYQGDERQRMKDLALTAANDGFVLQRSWTSRAVLPVLCGWGFRRQEVRRRGGTELLGFDEWHAADTQSFQRYWTRWRWSGPQCRSGESPTGWSAQEAYNSDQPEAGIFGGAPTDTGAAFRLSQVSKTTSTNYAGIQNFYDLSKSVLTQSAEPVMRLGIRVERDRQRLRVTDGSAAIKQGQGQLSTFVTDAASSGRGAAMHGVSMVEVYYRNPNAGRQAELGSLFLPYWQVRLSAVSLGQSWLPLGIASVF